MTCSRKETDIVALLHKDERIHNAIRFEIYIKRRVECRRIEGRRCY